MVQDTGETSNPPGEINLSTRNEPECQKCKRIIDRLKQEVSELRGRQLPGELLVDE